MTHTPTPWALHKREDETAPTLIIGNEDQNVADCSSWHMSRSDVESADNAAFIVKAVNSHDRLVEALRGMLAMYAPRNGEVEWDGPCAAARELLEAL